MIVDSVATHSESRSVGLVNLLWMHTEHEASVCDVFASVFWNVIEFMESNGFGWVCDTSTKAFGKLSKFIC